MTPTQLLAQMVERVLVAAYPDVDRKDMENVLYAAGVAELLEALVEIERLDSLLPEHQRSSASKIAHRALAKIQGDSDG